VGTAAFAVPTSERCPLTVRLVTADPPRDETDPARNRQLAIPSGPPLPALGRPAQMNALMLQAAGARPHPTMMLLHGLPGSERNFDLAQAARRAGWNVLTFTYRGAWGSEGTFSIQHSVADAQAALAFLRSPEAQHEYRIDPETIVLAGHGLGGYLAAHVAVNDDGSGDRAGDMSSIVGRRSVENPFVSRAALTSVVMIDPWDVAATARELKAGGAEARARFVAGLADLGGALGPITADDIADNLIRRGEEWSLAALAEPLARRMHFLLISARHGRSEDSRSFLAARNCPGFSCPGFQAVLEVGTDHEFSDKRMDLAVEVVAWLRQMAQEPC
jgi:pimeloyl-ACP methyl ester carboxylesterase